MSSYKFKCLKLILLYSFYMKYNYFVLTNDRDFIYISNIISISTFSKLFLKKYFW